MVKVISKKESLESQVINASDYIVIDCTSKSIDTMMAHSLSPFYLGPIECYDGLSAKCFENVWQYAKVYPCMTNKEGNPTDFYFHWRDSGFNQIHANRYPMGKGIKPLYSYWKIEENYYKLDYIQARKLIYIPFYAKAVIKTEGFARLQDLLKQGYNLALADFDGYNNDSFNLNMKQVVNNPKKIMGHAFVLKMLLDELISVENGEVVYSEELKRCKG